MYMSIWPRSITELLITNIGYIPSAKWNFIFLSFSTPLMLYLLLTFVVIPIEGYSENLHCSYYLY